MVHRTHGLSESWCSKWYQCYADEHYFATVLALYRRDGETNCAGHLVASDWRQAKSHPRAYLPENVTAELCALEPCTQSRGYHSLYHNLLRVMQRAALE